MILLGAAAALLVPWMAVLALTLPGSTRVHHWSLAWIGLDVLLAAGCAATAFWGLRGDPRSRLTASATASVAVLDAWFDITTAHPGTALLQALACAVAEGTVAGVCVALALSKGRWSVESREPGPRRAVARPPLSPAHQPR
ncbi:hypothetical protein GCM10018980_07350 [Streptomyces capoamus]|uniref:Uncharacterized protein n=1 Tax=Streptomyces capoamus TaxID=68183 RepID=A0A919C1T5_9ACTN|nr:hypothetical protein GCM10010501_38470 [Streptomyces libani subsp. rufus]GHG36523.1 hypothetical protein GCM10018980_07350 [Streptomyces capoamus]